MAQEHEPGARRDVDAYVADLATSAARAEPGQFTLERGRARELLAAHQLADSTHWILLAVQAAVLRGATRITATITALDVDLHFDGAPFSAAELDRLYDEAVAPTLATTDLARARRKLALALNSVRALVWSELTVDSGDGTQATRLLSRPPDHEVVAPAPGPLRGTRIHVIRNHREPGELAALRSRCRHAPVALVANDETLAPSVTFTPDAPRQALVVGSARGTAGFAPRFDAPSVLRLVQHGVLLEELRLPEVFELFLAVVDAPDQRTDLTGLHPVRDQAHQDLIDAVTALHAHLRSGADLPALEQRWLEAEARVILSALEPTCQVRRRRGFVYDVVFHLGFLQLPAIPVTIAMSGGQASLALIATIEAAVLLGSLATAFAGPLILAPHSRDPVARRLEEWLRGHPGLRATTTRIAKQSRSPLVAYLEKTWPKAAR